MQVPVELKRIYLDRRQNDILKLKRQVQQGDFSLAMKVGHQLKGNGETFEFPEMASFGATLELAALEGNVPRIQSLLFEMEEFLILKCGDLDRKLTGLSSSRGA